MFETVWFDDPRGSRLLANPDENAYAMECPYYTMEETLVPGVNTTIYVRQNTTAGVNPILRTPTAWRDAAAIGKFNYTACTHCNYFNYSPKTVSPKPDCDGKCFFIEDVRSSTTIVQNIENSDNWLDYTVPVDSTCDEAFNCGACDSFGRIELQPEHGWYFNDVKCDLPQDCIKKTHSCTYCKGCTEIPNYYDFTYIKDIVDIIIYGVKIKNCYDFCRFVNLNYNNADYIDIVTIVRALDCIINETCISNNVCNP